MLKILLIISAVVSATTVKYWSVNCNERIEIIQKVVYLDSAYQCSTFTVSKDTVLLKVDTVKTFPTPINSLCK